MGLQKVQKQGRDENSRRLSCYQKVVVEKDWKPTLHLLYSQTTEVELSILQVFFNHNFPVVGGYLCFIQNYFLFFLLAHSYL